MLTLDLACPIAWRTAAGSVEQTLSAAFSPTTPTLTGRSRTAQNDYFGEEVLSNIVASSSKLGHGEKTDDINDDGEKKADDEGGEEGVIWLARRYHETLWLGQEHSPLIGFLHHLSRFERVVKKTRRGEGMAESSVAVQARSLLRSRRQIRKRYASATEAAGGGGGCGGGGGGGGEGGEAELSASAPVKKESFVQELARESNGQVDTCAEEVIKMAIDSGPGRLVGDELSRAKGGDNVKQGMGRMTKVWLQAIECRELQIQILLVLYLLQLSTRLPPTSSLSSSSIILPAKGTTITTIAPTADQLDEQRSPLQTIEPNASLNATTPPASSATTKRKRKTDHARRWTGVGGKGMMAAFPWTLQRQTSRDGGQQQMTMDKEREEIECTSAESLSKRFESLLDSLSLQVLTCSVGLDAKSILSSPSSSHTIRVRERLQPWQLFGSEGRRRQRSKEDKKDVLQWLCCSVIEPYFSKTLPRQCGIVRGKCFIPGSGTTPAKPARKELPKVRGERDKDRDRDSRRRRERQEEDRNERARRSASRGKSPSPAPTPWSLLRNQAADESKQPVSRSSAFLEKLDARTVNVRKKWARSQSIGPLPSSNGSQADSQQQQQQQQQQQAPSRSLSSFSSRGNSVQPDPRSASHRQSRPSLEPKVNRRESQTLVMATPSKSQAYAHLPRSSSFSTSNAAHLSSSTSSSAVPNINSWRRTESQPVLMNAVGQRGSRIHDEGGGEDDDAWMKGADEEQVDDIAADEQIVDSLFFDESDEEDEGEAGFPLVDSPIQTKRAILDAAYNDRDDDIRNEDDDFDGEIVVAAKKRRMLPNSFSFAFLGGESTTLAQAPPLTTITTAAAASQTQNHARNPFAVSQS